MTYKRAKPVRCQSCGRRMYPGDQYFMIRGKIVCTRPDCMAKAHAGKCAV